MARHNELGRIGEDLACEKLVREGYAIVERNWRMHHYEIDIVAVKGDRVVFAEVKTIDEKKMANMARAADIFVQTYGLKHEAQFDVFGVSLKGDEYKVEHIADAFLPPLKQYSK